MFAKLKKKVIEENGGRNMESGDRPLPGAARHSSGSSVPIHSPLAKEAPGGFGGLKAAYSTERLVTSDEPEGRESSISKDDLMALLTKRTEQCKKMEGNISDLAALIKDKNKTIDILETQTKQHEEAVSRRLAEQKSEFEAYQDKLIAGYQEDKLALDKEKRELVRKLQLAEEYRDKFLKWEADTDEMKDFTVQELGKVKHMLINAQSDLETCRKELDSKTQTLTAVQSREKQLETDLYQWKEKAESLEKKCEVLAEDNKERAELVTSLTKEKSVFERRLDQLNAELTERQGQMAELNRQLTELDSSYRALEHSSEQHRNKTAKLLAEKQDHIDTLQERVSVLEQRLHDGSLSGDDRVAALQTEREGLEKKLLETREQLSEIKSTWSDKISHLEAQISHLNTKTMEDSEELVNSQRAADSMRENFHKQMEDLRHQLEDAEKRALENYELACGKDMHHGQQVKELESELNRLRLSSVDLETQLRGEINSLEYQLLELQRARQAERDSFRQELEEEKTRCEEAVERELHVERALKAAETQHAQLQIEMLSQQEELSKLRHQLEETSLNSTGQSHKVIELEQQVGSLRADLNSSMADLSSARRQLNQIDEEKGELMVRNAQLSQQLTSVQQEESKRRADGECQLAERDLLVHRQEEVIVQLKNQLSLLEKQVQEFDLASASLVTSNHFEVTIRDLQDQLADKTRSLKKQEQTVKDLRQTLQRELKVQALPNDDTSDDNTLSPVPSRKISQRQTIAPTSTASQPPFISHSLHLLSSAAPSVSSPSMSSATVAVKPMTVMPLMQVSHERGVMVRRDLEQDINFQYLKHVVLKFMLSRESEAVQLIKAVAVLLNFTHQEQQLIKQTLEWKMSWFGPRPSMGKGQKSKIVPPSY